MSKEDSIYESAFWGDFDSVKAKVDQNSELVLKQDHKGRILLHWAAFSANVKLVEYLLEKKSPIDAVDDTGSTPLILSSSAGRTEIVKILIDNGATTNHKTTQGHSALQYACSRGWLEIVALLLGASADINIVDKRGATPLHRAASKGKLAIVKLLMAFKDSAGLRIDSQDIEGNTPLHLACEEDRYDEAIVLVKNRADIQMRNIDSKTPLDLCSHCLHKVHTLRKSNK